MGNKTLLLLAEGNAETWQSWSGSSYGLVQALRRHAWEVRTSDVLATGMRRYTLMARSFHPQRKRWAARYHFGRGIYAQQTAAATAAARRRPSTVLVQIGATFEVRDPLRRPRFIYCDANAAFAARSPEYSAMGRLTAREFDALVDREKSVYHSCDGVFAFSDRLRQSLIEDFKLPPERVWTVYGGANLQQWPQAPDREVPAGPPTILFVGKDFERKGGPDLLEAFDLVQASIPDARLVLVGRIPEIGERPGVEVVGELRRENGGLDRLASLYQQADVFCMPSRYEPFGVVFVEAMLHGVPCIGTDEWAMPEIIHDGETGWVAKRGDPVDLAARLVGALGDRDRLRVMGMRAHKVASEKFTWDAVVHRMESALEGLGILEA